MRRPGRGTSRGAATLLLLSMIGAQAHGGAGVGQATAAAANDKARLLALQRTALEALRPIGSGAPAPEDTARGLEQAARSLDALAAGSILFLPAEWREELSQAARDLRARADAKRDDSGPWLDPYLKLLERVGTRLEHDPPLGLDFQGSYVQTQTREPVYGGHASAMGPAPRTAPSSPAGGRAAVAFEEVAGLAARTYCGGPTKDHILESGGSGTALFDYDGDGRLDVYLVTAFELDSKREPIAHRNALFRNLGDWRFQDVSREAGLDAAAWGNGVCAGDYDDDGDLDLYVTNWGPNFLFRNEGGRRFSEVAAGAGVQASGWSTGCTFFDADDDGDLDLYVARYVRTSWEELARARRTLSWRNGPDIMVGPAGLPGEGDLFFDNRGDGRFVEASEERGLKDAGGGYGFGVLATDYDDDGRTDLFVANDSTPNFLYHNLGAGRFESAGLVAGVALNADARAQAGMGVDSGDADGDGRLDLVLTTFAHDSKTLYRNLGAGSFEDASAASGLAAASFEPMGWGVSFLDADLDGDQDLLLANGHIFADVDSFPALRESFRQPNQLLLNEGGVFRDVSADAGRGLAVRQSSRGLAIGDLDGDGDLDAVVSNMDESPTLLRNAQRTGHRWIALRLDKPGRNRFAIGARVTLDAAGRRQVREVRSGGSYLSQSGLSAHFGLGRHAGAVDAEVRLGARRWRFRALATDRLHTLVLDDEHEQR